MSLYPTVVAATDFSDHATAAVRHAGALAKKIGSKLIVLYAVHDRVNLYWIKRAR